MSYSRITLLIALGAISANVTYTIGVVATEPRSTRNVSPKSMAALKLPTPAKLSIAEADLFKGASDSIVARTVGHAEGTRGVDGVKTQAYHGHSDPGNAVWNIGSFSYQHANSGPADADAKQLARLERQFAVISQQAASKKLVLTDLEKLNAIDLANQAPLAALDRGGFIDRLTECKRDVLCARAKSFVNPRSGRLEAPGLGGNMPQVERDQQRRMTAIQSVLRHQQKK